MYITMSVRLFDYLSVFTITPNIMNDFLFIYLLELCVSFFLKEPLHFYLTKFLFSDSKNLSSLHKIITCGIHCILILLIPLYCS